ncbi:MAG: response regulator transcription factor [Paludibacteraceae bacterium]|nr:response regulator transcription factor [Paludibacteraceae bacterium]
MSELLSQDRQAMQIVSRFGIPMGVGDKTIEAVCREHGIHTPTFLAIVNLDHSADRPQTATMYPTRASSLGTPALTEYRLSEDIDLPTLQMYLKNAHTYFLDFLLPRLRRQLIEAINPTAADNQIPMLIVRYFDEYVQEIRTHIEHENDGRLEEHATDDRHIAQKLHELVNLIVKYYPAHSTYPFANELMTTVLLGIYQTEEELKTHCAIEDEILRPALVQKKDRYTERRKTATPKDASEELSKREKEVLTLVVQGLMNKEIADKLHLSLHTVLSHRKNIAKKLNIHSTAGLTIYAIVNHLVDI